MDRINLIKENQIDIATLHSLAVKPPVFEPGEELFWTDPHISQQMLLAHLNPETDAASRRPETIDCIVTWIIQRLRLPEGAAIIDLGCGPGLYTSRLARHGFQVTGVDFSRNSLEYARRQAEAEGLPVEYVYQDYRKLEISSRFDLALLIYYDLGVFAPDDLNRVLANTARALKPGGRFVFDLVTEHSRSIGSQDQSWRVELTGFWRPAPHLVLSQRFNYPQDCVNLDQYIVVDASGETAVYRVWEQYYSPETIRKPLERAGMVIESLYSDLVGTPYSPSSPSMGIVARKL